MTDGERQKGDGGRDFCNRQAPSNKLLPGLAVVAWPSFGLVADANQAHRGDTDARALTKTRHDQNHQPKFLHGLLPAITLLGGCSHPAAQMNSVRIRLMLHTISRQNAATDGNHVGHKTHEQFPPFEITFVAEPRGFQLLAFVNKGFGDSC
jgi:hypothetical protein